MVRGSGRVRLEFRFDFWSHLVTRVQVQLWLQARLGLGAQLLFPYYYGWIHAPWAQFHHDWARVSKSYPSQNSDPTPFPIAITLSLLIALPLPMALPLG